MKHLQEMEILNYMYNFGLFFIHKTLENLFSNIYMDIYICISNYFEINCLKKVVLNFLKNCT